MANVCGTGGWIGPLPGDPDNNVLLTATPAFGGIDVSWTYPQTYPHAVAHTLVYRGINNNYSGAIQQAIVSGNFFYDKVATGDIYYYWIQIVSINGTVGDLIGPAASIARPLIEDLIIALTENINIGLLTQSLQNEINLINPLANTVEQVILDGIAESSATNLLIAQVQSDTAAAIEIEATARADKDGALSAQYTIKTDVAGLISGFGLASTLNDAVPTSEFGVRASTFFVAPPSVAQAIAPTVNLYDGYVWRDTSVSPHITRYYKTSTATWVLTSPVLPFIIKTTPSVVGGVDVPVGVYIQDAYIATLEASKIRTGSLSAGVILTGSIDVTSNVSGARMEIKNDVIKVFDSSNVLRVRIGNLV